MSIQPIDRNSKGFQCVLLGPSQKLSVSGTPAAAAAFSSSTRVLRLFPTVDVWIAIGDSPTAAANDGTSAFLPGGILQWVGIEEGELLSVIQDASSGTLHVLEGY